ncbi:hypothetical protein GQ472_06455 [archaeon]|nr:hypothetical protein [archaeon]
MVKTNVRRKGITPVIAIVLLLMMTVAAAGLAYEFIMNMSEKQTEAIGEQVDAQSNKMRTEFRIIQVKGAAAAAGDVDYYIKNVGSLEIPEFDGTKLSVKEDGDLRFDATFAGTCTSVGTIEVGDVCVLEVTDLINPLALPGDSVTTVTYELILDSGVTVSYGCNLANAADTFC